MKFELHPACQAWPAMPAEELAALAADIAANGLRDPLTLTPAGLLLDGRNRALACEMAGIEPATVVYDGDPTAFSLSKNKNRRHMAAEQISMAVAALVTTKQGMNRFVDSSNELSIAEAAAISGVSETSVKAAKTILQNGSPEEIQSVKAGKANLRKTADAVRARTRAKKREELRPIIRDKLERGETINRTELQVELGVSDMPLRTAEAWERGRLEALEEVSPLLEDAKSKLSATAQQKLEAFERRIRSELMSQFDRLVKEEAERKSAAEIASRDAADLELVEQCREFHLRVEGRYRPPFTNEEFKLVLSALHPDASTDRRIAAFALFKRKELLLRSADEKDFNKIRGIAPLPATVEELMARRKVK